MNPNMKHSSLKASSKVRTPMSVGMLVTAAIFLGCWAPNTALSTFHHHTKSRRLPFGSDSLYSAVYNGCVSHSCRNNKREDSLRLYASKKSRTRRKTATPALQAAGSAGSGGLAPAMQVKDRAQINIAIIGSLLAFALYQLLHVDVEAIVALYTYDVEIDRLVTATELLLRLPVDALASYEEQVIANPILAKAATSGVSYFAGDIVAQYITTAQKDIGKIDLTRSTKSSIAGFVGHGPILHFWLQALANVDVGCPNYYLNFCFKLLLDQGPMALVFNSVYISLLAIMNRRNPGEVIGELKEKTISGVLESIKFWPFVHLVTYNPMLPMNFKLLWVDVMEIVWVSILAQVANNDRASLTSTTIDGGEGEGKEEEGKGAIVAAENE